jgi:hypothetical protein
VRNWLKNSIMPAVALSAVLAISTYGQGRGGQAAPQAKQFGPVPKALDGKPDLSRVWDHPFAINMAVGGRGDACGGGAVSGCKMAGPESGGVPMTPAGEAWFKSYDATNYDATAHCNPMGYTRSMNAPVPTQIVQRPDVIVFLHESMFAFHNVYMDGRKHPTKEEALETTWYGHSTGKWDGDTLVIDTVGPFFGTPTRRVIR